MYLHPWDRHVQIQMMATGQQTEVSPGLDLSSSPTTDPGDASS